MENTSSNITCTVTQTQRTAINGFVGFILGRTTLKGCEEYETAVVEDEFEEKLSGWIKSMYESNSKHEYILTQKSALKNFFINHSNFDFEEKFKSKRLISSMRKWRKKQHEDHPDDSCGRGLNATDPFSDKEVVEISKYLLRNDEIFMFVVTSVCLNIGCRPEDFFLTSFATTTKADVSTHRFFIRTDYNKGRWLPLNLVVYPNLCELAISWPIALSIALTKIDSRLKLKDANFVKVLSESLGYKNMSKKKIEKDFKEIVKRALGYSDRLSIYSYRKYCLTYTSNNTILSNVSPFVSARAGHSRMDHFASDKSTKNWIQSNDMDSHYRALTDVGDTIVARVAAWRHPQATCSRDYMIDYIKSVKPEWIEQVFPSNVRSFFPREQLEMHLKYLLIAQAKGLYNSGLPTVTGLVDIPLLPPPNYVDSYESQIRSPFLFGPREYFVDEDGNLCEVEYEVKPRKKVVRSKIATKKNKRGKAEATYYSESDSSIDFGSDDEMKGRKVLESDDDEEEEEIDYESELEIEGRKVLDSESESESSEEELELDETPPTPPAPFRVDEFLGNDEMCETLKEALSLPKKGSTWEQKCEAVKRQWFEGNIIPNIPALCEWKFNWNQGTNNYESKSKQSQLCSKVKKRKNQAENLKKYGNEQCLQYLKNKHGNQKATMDKLGSKIIKEI